MISRALTLAIVLSLIPPGEATNKWLFEIELIACIVLDHRGWDIRESLVVSLANPGAVFRHYCPWRADWAAYDRIYPRAG